MGLLMAWAFEPAQRDNVMLLNDTMWDFDQEGSLHWRKSWSGESFKFDKILGCIKEHLEFEGNALVNTPRYLEAWEILLDLYHFCVCNYL